MIPLAAPPAVVRRADDLKRRHQDDRALLQALATAVSGIVAHLGLAPVEWGERVAPERTPPSAAVFGFGDGGPFVTFEWDESQHPRDDHGRFEGGGFDALEVAGSTITLDGRPDGTGTPADPIYVGKDLDRAQQLLAEGKSIRLDDKKVASILVARIGAYAQQLKARGEKAPNFDLCRVSVADTNVFCAGSRGVPRAQMPQLRGPAEEGSTAAAKRTDPTNVNESVSVEAEFAAALRASGVAIEDKSVSAGMLRPTQAEINGAKTGSILQGMLAGKETLGGKQIWTTKDGYVLDGHHRWAAGLAQSLLVGGDGGSVEVHEVQIEIGGALDFARAFTKEQGLRQLDVSAFAILRFVLATEAVVAFEWDESKHPRDEKGRFGPGDGATQEIDVPRYASLADVRPAPGFNQRLGNCYEEAARHVLNTPGATLVHGTIRGSGLPPITHAWAVDPDGAVYEAVMQVRFHPDDHASLFNPVVHATYDDIGARVEMVSTENWGPWNEESLAFYEQKAG